MQLTQYCKMKFLIVALLVSAFEASTGLTITDTIHLTPRAHGISGSGTTTRYWDCCKPSCAWSPFSPVASCTADGVTKAPVNTPSGCEAGGTAYMCSDQESITVNNTFAMGFAAASFSGGVDDSYCCACFLLSFQNQITNKQMVVQVTNTGSDLGANHFDIAIPGGGTGIFSQGCSNQWGDVGGDWNVNSESDCANLPSDLQIGCEFRFEFMEGASNPSVDFTEVDCPSQLTGITGCSA